ncbi:MAG: hypothetical protein K6E60_05825 [Saccharofermentans sp.]|nr:hypothetical protein [Saccharofermentans sp.]
MNVLKGIKTRALLMGALVVSFLISGCGVKKDSDDKVMLQIGNNITEVTSDGQKKLLDKGSAEYWQYDPDDKLLIASRTNVQIYNMETGAITKIGQDMLYNFEYEEQKMVGLNAWYENGKVYVYALNQADDTLVVFTYDYKTEKLEDTARYDIKGPRFVRDTGNLFAYMSGNDLNIYDKQTGENKTVATDIGKQPERDFNELIVLNGDKSKVLFVKTIDDAPALYEYEIPSGETREVYKCSKGNYITGFTYALGSNKIYLRYGKKKRALFNFGTNVYYQCQPNHTMVITTDGRNYELHSSVINGYNWQTTGIVIC